MHTASYKQWGWWFVWLFLADTLVVGLCWNLSYFLRFELLDIWFTPSIIPAYPIYAQTTLPILLLVGVFLVQKQIYRLGQSGAQVNLEAIFEDAWWVFIFLLALSFFYREFSFSRLLALIFWVCLIPGLWCSRQLVLKCKKQWHKQGHGLQNVLVVGSGRLAENFVRQIDKCIELGLCLQGFVSNNTDSQLTPHFVGYQNLAQHIRNLNVQHLYIALEADEQHLLPSIEQQLSHETVDLHLVLDWQDKLSIRPELLEFYNVPVLVLRQSPLLGYNRLLKRAFDLVGALGLIVLCLPLWLLLPLIIKLNSKGPVFYVQSRVGMDNQIFPIIKFRTMRQNAEQQGAVWAYYDDQRATTVGKFLRKSSLDELPQLFNVLLGHMSLVGPRPERPSFVEQFRAEIPNYILRHKTQAGITGWAQVNGWRGRTSLAKRIEYDLYYVTHWSLWLDVKILFMTLNLGFWEKKLKRPK